MSLIYLQHSRARLIHTATELVMENSGNNKASLFDIETFLNNLIQRLFPVWYAVHAAREMPLQPLGVLNPNSFLSHRWLSLHAVFRSLAESLQAQDKEWQPLCDLLEKVLVEREFRRPLSVSALDGIEHSTQEEDWPNLLSWAEHTGAAVAHETAEDFDLCVHRAFPQEESPHRVVYREWDGRYYWQNKEDNAHFAAALLYAHEKQRDMSFSALINVESVNSKVLDRIRNDYWLLLLARESAYPIHDLMVRADLPVALAEFEWRRGDLVFMVARKNNRHVNRILLNLLDNRSTQHILEFGRWLGRRHFPFRNQ